jgi:AcrR family transcriptional regulator
MPVAGRRMAGEERRLQILRVAMKLFSQRGFRGTTTKEIATAAGVSEAMVFRHFATKDDLYTAILDHKACAGGMQHPRDMVADAIRQKDDRAVFEGLANGLMCHHQNDTEFLRLLTHSALEEHQLADMFWETTVREMYKFLGSYIRERRLCANEHGHCRAGVCRHDHSPLSEQHAVGQTATHSQHLE